MKFISKVKKIKHCFGPFIRPTLYPSVSKTSYLNGSLFILSVRNTLLTKTSPSTVSLCILVNASLWLNVNTNTPLLVMVTFLFNFSLLKYKKVKNFAITDFEYFIELLFHRDHNFKVFILLEYKRISHKRFLFDGLRLLLTIKIASLYNWIFVKVNTYRKHACATQGLQVKRKTVLRNKTLNST